MIVYLNFIQKGKRNMNTAMLLKPKSMVSYIYGDLTPEEGLKIFLSTGFAAVPVIDRGGIYIGVVSERIFLYRILSAGSIDALKEDGVTVADLANDSRFEEVTIDAGVDTLMSRITEQNFVPVVDSRGMFSGIVTRRDVLKAMKHKLSDAKK